jgi:hypothetical protein
MPEYGDAGSLPGSPNAAQLAAADQKHAAVRTAVDRLVTRARMTGITRSGDTGDWIRFVYGDVVDEVAAISGSDDGVAAAALGLAGEAVLRLTAREV